MAVILPELTDYNRFFWTSGADGQLRILRCSDCGAWLHPPGPICPTCQSRRVEPQVVSGRATVEAVTVNHQAWSQDASGPYAIARVTLDDAPPVRLTTRIVGMAAQDVVIGQSVKVCFVQREDVYLPFFEPL